MNSKLREEAAMTNQASEDLFAGLDKISGYNRLLPTAKGQPEDACNVCGLSPESLKEAIQSAIRTEKLKLLAEVRERVIKQAKPDKRKATSWRQGIEVSAYENAVRFYEYKMNEQLTKLEAEL